MNTSQLFINACESANLNNYTDLQNFKNQLTCPEIILEFLNYILGQNGQLMFFGLNVLCDALTNLLINIKFCRMFKPNINNFVIQCLDIISQDLGQFSSPITTEMAKLVSIIASKALNENEMHLFLNQIFSQQENIDNNFSLQVIEQLLANSIKQFKYQSFYDELTLAVNLSIKNFLNTDSPDQHSLRLFQTAVLGYDSIYPENTFIRALTSNGVKTLLFSNPDILFYMFKHYSKCYSSIFAMASITQASSLPTFKDYLINFIKCIHQMSKEELYDQSSIFILQQFIAVTGAHDFVSIIDQLGQMTWLVQIFKEMIDNFQQRCYIPEIIALADIIADIMIKVSNQITLYNSNKMSDKINERSVYTSEEAIKPVIELAKYLLSIVIYHPIGQITEQQIYVLFDVSIQLIMQSDLDDSYVLDVIQKICKTQKEQRIKLMQNTFCQQLCVYQPSVINYLIKQLFDTVNIGQPQHKEFILVLKRLITDTECNTLVNFELEVENQQIILQIIMENVKQISLLQCPIYMWDDFQIDLQQINELFTIQNTISQIMQKCVNFQLQEQLCAFVYENQPYCVTNLYIFACIHGIINNFTPDISQLFRYQICLNEVLLQYKDYLDDAPEQNLRQFIKQVVPISSIGQLVIDLRTLELVKHNNEESTRIVLQFLNDNISSLDLYQCKSVFSSLNELMTTILYGYNKYLDFSSYEGEVDPIEQNLILFVSILLQLSKLEVFSSMYLRILSNLLRELEKNEYFFRYLLPLLEWEFIGPIMESNIFTNQSETSSCITIFTIMQQNDINLEAIDQALIMITKLLFEQPSLMQWQYYQQVSQMLQRSNTPIQIIVEAFRQYCAERAFIIDNNEIIQYLERHGKTENLILDQVWTVRFTDIAAVFQLIIDWKEDL
ncbi:Hypothetical_protein [Hexamita inflata]|uniref:Hypothetical_protein n=1 Tax=Hexamita inflata TaxID=28002 RepID=A0AA86QHH5_9EUKA|nr:Hypothetical protein HINF_LOCUS46018 [Hexamita inflata]